MKSIEFEGTLGDIQKQIRGLPYQLDTRVRVRIDDASAVERTPIDFVPREFKNGVPLLPRNRGGIPVTSEFIRSLSEEDEETIR